MTWHQLTIDAFALIGLVNTTDWILGRTGGAIGTRWRTWRSIRRHRRSAPQHDQMLDH